jgi:hypothetical protein
MRTETVNEVNVAWEDFLFDFKESNLYQQILDKDISLDIVTLNLKVAFLSGVVAEIQKGSGT